MQLITAAIVPVIILLVVGAVIRRKFLTEPAFWRGLEWLSYHVFTPALFVESIAQTDLTGVSVGPLLVSLAVPTVVVSALLIALRRVLRATGPQLTSLVQGSIRLNTYIGLVFASALHGVDGVASFALAAAVMVPLVNVICVTALSFYGTTGDGRKRTSVWREILTNPLILGCATGLALNLTGLGLPSAVAAPVEILASPALVCGTLAAGAAISLQLRRRDALDIALVSALKLVAMPLAAAGLAAALGVDGIMLTCITIICALPTAPSAYVLATRMGGDERLMASITGAQTVLSMATMPLMLAVAAGI
ncbi:AEC family transporter [Mycobacterium sp. PS03-16]|uniref:AEC family transporter n=1 Tax=Mycobacterium sp. PS03-16 TaxID=2559611 RepID=UPI001073A8BF|nr:AEC family transporter [Mycobacterium sp. PS03-16]TFV61080.1 AEC family transporter [Mycobacterium sp. PS03-16]